jgi:hypothetical protein
VTKLKVKVGGSSSLCAMAFSAKLAKVTYEPQS